LLPHLRAQVSDGAQISKPSGGTRMCQRARVAGAMLPPKLAVETENLPEMPLEVADVVADTADASSPWARSAICARRTVAQAWGEIVDAQSSSDGHRSWNGGGWCELGHLVESAVAGVLTGPGRGFTLARCSPKAIHIDRIDGAGSSFSALVTSSTVGRRSPRRRRQTSPRLRVPVFYQAVGPAGRTGRTDNAEHPRHHGSPRFTWSSKATRRTATTRSAVSSGISAG
jgi:hypothetical protein